MGARIGRRWTGIVVTLLIAAPAVAAIVALAGRHWWPTDDFAIIDLRVRDVFTANSPLTGLYSRPGWNHPAPIMFWAMAPLSWATGHAPWATRIGGAVMQAVALVWLGVATARRSTRLLLAAGVVCSCTYLASNQWLFREPWNLHIPVPFFILFLFLTYFVATGEFGQLIGMSVAATVTVSTHIGYAPLVLAGFVYALAWTVVDARRRHAGPSGWRRTLALSVAVFAVTWIAPLVDVVVHWPGNLGKIARYFVGGNHASVGLGAATHYMADAFRWVPPWLGGSHRLEPFTGHAVPASLVWLAIPVGLVIVGAVAARVSRDRDLVRLVGLATVMLAVGVVAISGADEPRAYTFQWRATVAAFLAVACASAVVVAIGRRYGTDVAVGRRLGVLIGIAVIAWGSVVMTVAVVRRPSALLATREGDLRAMMKVVDASGVPHGILRVRPVGTSLPSLFDGVVNELDRRGVDVRVDPERGRVFGSARTIARSVQVPIWYVTEAGSQVPVLLARYPGARVIADTSPLDAAEENELARIQADVGRKLDAAGQTGRRQYLDSSFVGFRITGIPGITPLEILRLAQLNGRLERAGRCRCAIVAVPAADATAAPGT